jgi:3,5-dioxohexanoate:acetyl-CoA acetone transferase
LILEKKENKMPETKKSIITCAVTGAALSPSMSPYLPYTPDQIVEQAIDAAQAGAAIVHLHARRPEDGCPTNDLSVWMQYLPRIKSGCDAIINMSIGGGGTLEQRLEPVLHAQPEMATVNVSSMTYGLFKKAEGFREWKFDWEKEYYGPKSYSVIAENRISDVDRMIDVLSERGIIIEFECYDVGHIYVLAYLLKKKEFDYPFMLQFITGILGGIPSDIEHLLHMKRSADQLFGRDYELCIQGTQQNSMQTATVSGLLGANVRVGQEDSLFDLLGNLYKSNADQVNKLKRIFTELNIGIATPGEARKRLGTKGKDAQAF